MIYDTLYKILVCSKILFKSLFGSPLSENQVLELEKVSYYEHKKKYKKLPHEDASTNGTSTDSKIAPFAIDTLGNFCSVSIILLKALAKVKCLKTPGSKESQEQMLHPFCIYTYSLQQLLHKDLF